MTGFLAQTMEKEAVMERNFETGSYQQLLYTAFEMKHDGEYNGNPYIIQEIVRERNLQRNLMREERTL